MHNLKLHEKTVGIIANIIKENTAQVAQTVLHELCCFGITYILEEKTATFLNQKNGLPFNELLKNIDWLIVIGGDGTILQTIHEIDTTAIPILGVNLKTSFGFLTETYESHFQHTLKDIVENNFRYIERSTFNIEHRKTDGTITRYPRALNDIALSHGGLAKMIEVSVKINENHLTDYLGDGVIFATASGSTAHSLSAGGPIMFPNTDAFLITPICPHTLSQRPIILPRGSIIEAETLKQEINISTDGIVQATLKLNESLKITLGEHITFINSKNHSFVKLLQNKLHWSGKMHKNIL